MVAHTLFQEPVPLDTVLHLPAPPSVNLTRRIDWANRRQHKAWEAEADMTILAAGGMRHLPHIHGRFEAYIVVDHSVRIDLDNAQKAVIDYARRINLIIDDGPDYMLGVHTVRGDAPTGCTLTLRSIP